MVFGLRRGDDPHCVITTPKTIPLLTNPLKDPTVCVTRGSTHDNARNLAHAFLSKIIARYEGTRLGRPEIEEIESEKAHVAAVPVALFKDCLDAFVSVARAGFAVKYGGV